MQAAQLHLSYAGCQGCKLHMQVAKRLMSHGDCMSHAVCQMCVSRVALAGQHLSHAGCEAVTVACRMQSGCFYNT